VTTLAASFSDRLQDVIHSPGVTPLAFLLAFVAGAGHAVTPGHGKSLAAAYLVGSRGRVRDAAWLGGSVAVMHTLSVLVIGVAWTFLSLSDVIRMETLTTWLQIGAGVIVLATGIWILLRHLRGGGHSHDHHHGHTHSPAAVHAHGPADDHASDHGHALDHGHGAAHEHGHSHDHERDRVKRPGLLLLGISGGLTPSPAAFLVLATGLFLGRAGFALLLVLTFGLGMAVVLFGVGLLAVAGSTIVVRGARSHSLLQLATRVAPVLAAAGITVFGAVIIATAAFHLTTVT